MESKKPSLFFNQQQILSNQRANNGELNQLVSSASNYIQAKSPRLISSTLPANLVPGSNTKSVNENDSSKANNSNQMKSSSKNFKPLISQALKRSISFTPNTTTRTNGPLMNNEFPLATSSRLMTAKIAPMAPLPHQTRHLNDETNSVDVAASSQLPKFLLDEKRQSSKVVADLHRSIIGYYFF